MRKDTTKKFLGKENRYLGRMMSKNCYTFIFRKKLNINANQISYDKIEFRQLFSAKKILSSTKSMITNEALKKGDKFQYVLGRNGKRIEFNIIYCDKGSFTMGSDDPKDKNPKKQVEIKSPFWLGETEVTQEFYKLVMDENPSHFQGNKYPDSNKRPIENIGWIDAILFCNKLSKLMGKELYYKVFCLKHYDYQTGVTDEYVDLITLNKKANGFRLPSIEEWEYAAKAGTNNRWSGTDDPNKLGEYAWFGSGWSADRQNREGSTHPVATKKPNEWGFYDMTGNVMEYIDNEYRKPIVGYQYFDLKGGDYCRKESDIKIITEFKDGANSPDQNKGFRIAIASLC